MIGVSLGGAAALLNTATATDVDAVILKAVYPDFDSAVRDRIATHNGEVVAFFIAPMLTQ